MGFIPLANWGPKVCPNYLQTGSLVLYYNTQIVDSYPGVPGMPETQDGTHIFNLANSASYVGSVAGGIGTYNPTFLAIKSAIGVGDVPWNLYDGSPSTILIRGVFSFPTASNYFILHNTLNSNEGLQYYSATSAFGFSRGVNNCNNVMPVATGMNTQQNSFTTLAVVRENTPTSKLFLTSNKSNFGQQFTQSLAGCTIINDTDLFNTNNYIQSVAVYSKQLTQIELISASQAMECGSYPQGYVSPIVPSGSCDCVSTQFAGNGGKGHYGMSYSYIPCNNYIRYTSFIGPGATSAAICITAGSAQALGSADGTITVVGACTTGSCGPIIYNTCSCLSYQFNAGSDGLQTYTATGIMDCGGTITASINIPVNTSKTFCVVSQSAPYFGLTGEGATITLLGTCTTGSCP
jgi:hypothetical protein